MTGRDARRDGGKSSREARGAASVDDARRAGGASSRDGACEASSSTDGADTADRSSSNIKSTDRSSGRCGVRGTGDRAAARRSWRRWRSSTNADRASRANRAALTSARATSSFSVAMRRAVASMAPLFFIRRRPMASSNAVLFASRASVADVCPAAARRNRCKITANAPSRSRGGDGGAGAARLGVTARGTIGACLSARRKSSRKRAAWSLRRVASRPRNNSSSGGAATPSLRSARASSTAQFRAASARPGSKACVWRSRSGRAAWMRRATPYPSATASATRARAPGAMRRLAAQRSAAARAFASAPSLGAMLGLRGLPMAAIHHKIHRYAWELARARGRALTRPEFVAKGFGRKEASNGVIALTRTWMRLGVQHALRIKK